ncbi:hypothetical protein M8R20_05905 [Pseudomonas sp. R2.Fl]|nr:hypothetical protein [Pseudomonas sp. R2.Fl]
MSQGSLLSRLASFPERLGEMITGRREGVKALLAFTPLSRLVAHDPRQYDRQQRELVLLGRGLLAVCPVPMLSLARDVAMVAEGLGDEKAFASMMRRALKDADRLEARLAEKPNSASLLVDFHLSLMDFPAASRIAGAVRHWRPELAEDLARRIAALEAECAPWRQVVDRARDAFRLRVQGESRPSEAGSRLTLHVPVPAFRANHRDYPGFREDIRRSFRQIVSVLDEKGVAFDVETRLGKHGVMPSGKPFVAYHTVGGNGRGLHVKETDRRSHFSGDRGGYSGWSVFGTLPLPADGEFDRKAVEAFIAAERELLIAGNQSKYVQPDTGDARPSGPYVFVALQVIDDAVQRQTALHMFDMLEEVARTCAERGVGMVVKRHPLCRSNAVRLVLAKGVRRGLFSLSDGSIHELIANSCAVCVINSGVGAEALLHGKPVYTFGGAEYQAATFQVRERGDFARLFEPDRLPASREQIEALLFALRHRYAVDVRDEALALSFWRERIADLLAGS